MEKKPKALRLADALEISSNHHMRREAASELRRLHDLCTKLLEALEMALLWVDGDTKNIVRAAISKAKD